MFYDVISVRHMYLVCTVTFVKLISVSLVWENISQMNRKNTKWCHFERGDLRPNVQHIPQSNVNFTVNNVTFLYVCSVFLLQNMNSTKKIDALINLERKKKALEKDLQELENIIYPEYQEIASIVSVQRANVDKTYKKLKKTIDKQERDWHRDIDTIVKSLRADLESEKSRMSAFFDKHEGKIKHSIDEIKQTIVDI